MSNVALPDDPDYYAVGSGGGSSVYHTDPDCPRVQGQTDKLKPRTEHYVEWHDMTLCDYCPGEDA